MHIKISESLPVQSTINVSTQMETTIGHQANSKLRKHRASIAPPAMLIVSAWTENTFNKDKLVI